MKNIKYGNFDPYGRLINELSPESITKKLRILFFSGLVNSILFFVLWTISSENMEFKYLSTIIKMIFLTTIAFTIFSYSKFKFYSFKQKFDSMFRNISFFHQTLGGKEPYQHYRIAELDFLVQIYINRKFRNKWPEYFIALLLLLGSFNVLIIDFGNSEITNQAIFILSSTLNGYLVRDLIEGLIVKHEFQEKNKAERLDAIGPFY